MVTGYEKGISIKISDEFFSTDWDCQCKYPKCDITLIDDELVSGLDKLVLIFPIIHINSGFRCTEHNRDVGGKFDSMHLLGLAADVKSPFSTSQELANAAERVDCFRNGGIGVYSAFTHLDVRGHRARW